MLGAVLALLLGSAAQSSAFPGSAASRPHRSSLPAEVQVSSGDNWFNPNVIVVARGGTVSWQFVGKTHHTATDTTGMGLYNSGSLLTGTFAYEFPAAGVYGFYCILHPEMGGRIHVPMRAKPSKGARSTMFALMWASASAPDGYVYDVQLKRPGSSYQPWQVATTAASGSFKPDAGRGTYRFQARLHQVATGETSLWSDTLSVVVS